MIIVDFLQLGFPVGYECLVPTPATANHPLASSRPCDQAAYITTELREGTMLGPFHQLPFTHRGVR